MKWWHHLVAAGSLTLLYNVAWVNVVGGALAGIGFAWWLFGSAYRHDMRALREAWSTR